MDADPLIGQELGRYRIERMLGQGGMGCVYSAVNAEIGSRVAIKVLKAGALRDDGIVDRFFAEARAVNLIRHENIVNIIDLATLPDGRPFIVMEQLNGAPLTKLITPDAKLPLAGVARVILDVLAALDAAHALGIVHRDLKPDNVFVTPEGNGKVLDFGIAKLMPEHGATATREGLVFGTPLYMSPEQVTQAPLDARSDIYSLGVVLYEATTGALPFAAATTYEILQAHVERVPPPPKTHRPDLPDAFDALIVKALAKDPTARFASAVEMAAALAAAVAGLPNEPLTPPASRRISTPIATVSGVTTNETPKVADATAPDKVTRRTYERHRGRVRWLPFAALGLAVLVVVVIAALRC